MNHPHSAREALLAEALGETATLLDRIDAVEAALAATSESLTQACLKLEVQAAGTEARIAALAESAKAQASKHIARRSEELVRQAAEAETRSMATLVRALLHAELEPALRRLCQAVEARATKGPNLHPIWWACTASAAASSALAWGLTFYAMTR